MRRLLTLGAPIPVTDLTIQSVILFERAKVMTAIAVIHLCFGGESPLSYAENKSLAKFV